MSPEERGPIEGPLRRKAETDRVREGISEGFRLAEPEWVAPEVREQLSPSPTSPALPFPLALCKDWFSHSTDYHIPPLKR